MPKMVHITHNPDFRVDKSAPDADAQTKALAEVKKAAPVRVDYVTALENIRISKGMYRILPEAQPVKVQVDSNLAEMSLQELKVMMLNLGVKTTKQMSRSQVITLIEKKLDEVELVEDEIE